MNPLEFLEDVQREYMLIEFGEVVDYDDMYSDGNFFEFLEKEYHFKDSREELMRALREMRSAHGISRYENPYYYKYFSDIIGQIHKIKDGFLDCREKEPPLFGTVETAGFYAQIRCPDSSMPPLILFCSGIIQFAHDISNVLVKAFPLHDGGDGKFIFDMEPERVQEVLSANSWLGKRFADIAFSIFYFGNVGMSDVSQPEEDFLYRRFGNALADAFLTFVTAHECAHYYLEHLNPGAPKEIVNIGSVMYENIIPNWEQEFDADYIGALLTISALLERGMDISVILGGIYTAMWSVSMMESLQVRYEMNSATHPPAKDRLLQIKQKLQRSLHSDFGVLSLYDMVFSALWESFLEIAKDVEDKILDGRNEVLTTYEQVKNIIYGIGWV